VRDLSERFRERLDDREREFTRGLKNLEESERVSIYIPLFIYICLFYVFLYILYI
jgi:hypothetical protein